MSENRKTDIERLARLLGALSNPNRLELFTRVSSCRSTDADYDASQEPCACVGELAATTSLSQSTVSHHLKELRNAGLIRMERCGQRVECHIDTEILKELIRFLQQYTRE